MSSEDIPDDINSLESSQNNRNENLRSLSKNDNLNFNYTFRNNEIFYTPHRTFIEELEYANVLNPPVNNTLPKSNIGLPTGESFTSLPSRVPSRRSLLVNSNYRPTQSRMNSNLFIDYNVRNNLFTNQSGEPFSTIFDRPLNGTSNPQPFDGLNARRKIFNEMSSSSMTMRPQNYQANYQPNFNNNYVPNSGNAFTGNIDARMTPVSNPAMGTAAFNETIVSSNVEDLIDVMAKRRLAIKNLENEMNRQHSKGSGLVKSFATEPSRIDVNTRPQMDIYNSFRERQPNNNGPYYDPQKSLLGKTPVRNLNDPYQNQSNIISNLEYPSDSNREIYSTYLVDSIKPHYSARRLISGKPFPITHNTSSSAFQTTPSAAYQPTSTMPISSNPPINPQNNYPAATNFNQTAPNYSQTAPNYYQAVPNYNQSNSQPILENYKQQPVQPIVNNYGPVYNQPMVTDTSIDPGFPQKLDKNNNQAYAFRPVQNNSTKQNNVTNQEFLGDLDLE
ncbi:hypothetical protein BpHYR1_044800 [Brachionus plicatilis]|uniref:Uncharacterized protein n=1 Tax=Brachionus plicatilis TaxID=10195 RepID=A0A3M7QGM6_BRAPC|nr:hypothetical protein BpHYR1_044800 [Brachionus plicatilis]